MSKYGPEQKRYRWSTLVERVGLSMAILAIPGSLATTSDMDKDIPYTPPTLPPATASPTPGPSREPSPDVTPTISAVEYRECTADGKAESFSWPDFGIIDAEIELVGTVDAGNGETAFEAPHGKNSKTGAYNTAGLWKYGAAPGDLQPATTPEEQAKLDKIDSLGRAAVVLMHRAPVTGSLLKKDFASQMKKLKESGESSEVIFTKDNGATCTYEVNAETGIWEKVKKFSDKKDKMSDYAKLLTTLYDNLQQPKSGEEDAETELADSAEELFFITCAGDFDPMAGTSEDATVLRFTATN